MKSSTSNCLSTQPPSTESTFFVLTSIAKVGIMMVTGQMLPRPSLSCPKPFMSHPLAVLQPIVLNMVLGSFLSYPALPDQSTLA